MRRYDHGPALDQVPPLSNLCPNFLYWIRNILDNSDVKKRNQNVTRRLNKEEEGTTKEKIIGGGNIYFVLIILN